MTLLITGADGFVGSYVAAEAERVMGGQRIILGRRPGMGLPCAGAATPGPSSEWRDLDVTDADACKTLVDEVQPSSVIHLAAIAAPAEAQADAARAIAVNVGGVSNLTRALRSARTRSRFVFASSSEVYGRSFTREDLPISEGAALEPLTVYAETKAAAENDLAAIPSAELDVVRMRPFNHTGPGQTPSFVVPSFAKQVADIATGRSSDRSILVGNLDAKRDIIDVRDVARAYLCAALTERDPTMGNVFNLARGEAISIGVVLETLISLAGSQVDVRRDPDRMRPSDVPVVSGDPAAAHDAFGWRAEIPLRTTLQDVLAYWMAK